MFEEKLRRFVKERPARDLSASSDFDQASLHQILQDAIDRDPANHFDVSARDWLSIGNDRECLQ